MERRIALILIIITGSLLMSCGKEDPPIEETPIPTITDFFPMEGEAGTEVTINGTNFSPDNTIVDFNTWEGEIISISNTKIVARIPEFAEPGIGPISVCTGDGINYPQCASSNSEFTILETIEGIEVFTSELVSLNIEGLAENMIDGIFGEVSVTLVKVNEEEFLFQVPYDVPLGINRLTIPSLPSFELIYDVSRTILSDSESNLVTEYVNVIEEYIRSQEDDSTNDILKEYAEAFRGLSTTLTVDQNRAIAEYYYQNKDYIIEMINDDLTGRSFPTDEELVFRFGKAVVIMGIATYGLVAIPEPIVKAASLLIVITQFKKAYKIHNELSSKKIKVINFIIDDLLSTNRSTGAISLKDGISSTFEISMLARELNDGDRNDPSPGINSIFSSNDKLNELIELVNGIIQFINNNVPLANFNLISQLPIQANSSAEQIAIKESILEHSIFYVDHNNISIDAFSLFDSHLDMSVSVDAIDGSNGPTIQSDLIFEYEDEFNSLSGSFPLEVTQSFKDILIQNSPWNITFMTGYQECLPLSLTFTESSLNLSHDCGGTIFSSLPLTFTSDNSISVNNPVFGIFTGPITYLEGSKEYKLCLSQGEILKFR